MLLKRNYFLKEDIKTINYNDNSISMIKKNKRKINNMPGVYKATASV